jgi:hypothetical protein
MNPPLYVLAWVFWAITAMDPNDPTHFASHMHHAWTLEECEDRRQEFIDANVPYLSRCESIVAVARP